MRAPLLLAHLPIILASCASSQSGPQSQPGQVVVVPEPSSLPPSPPPPTASASSAPAPTASASARAPATAEAPKAPTGPCAVADVALSRLSASCDCTPESAKAFLHSTEPNCPGPDEPSTTKIDGLVVEIELESPQVRPGADVKATIRWKNTTDRWIPLRFLRDRAPGLTVRKEGGGALPIEGRDRCAIAGMVGMARLRGVWLSPKSAVTATATVPARGRKRVNGGATQEDCDTVPGAKLAAGRYEVRLDDDPLFYGGRPLPAPFTVAK